MDASSSACIRWSNGLGVAVLRSIGAGLLEAAVAAGTIVGGALVGAAVARAAAALVGTTALVGALALELAGGAVLQAARMGTSSRAAPAPVSQRESFIFTGRLLFGPRSPPRGDRDTLDGQRMERG